MKIVSFGDSKQGTDHTQNEDSMLIDNLRNVYAIADGVTNPEGGKEASIRAVTYLERFAGSDLKKSIETINGKILEDKETLHVGYSTIAAARIINNQLEVANVGDTPVFLVRDKGIIMLTVQDRFITGSLMQALGEPDINIHTTSEKLQPGDYVILTSDGVSNVLTEEDLLKIVNLHKEPESIVEAAFLAVEEEPREYDDDMTMIVLKIS